MPNKSPENQPKPPKLPENQTGSLEEDVNGTVDTKKIEEEGVDSLQNAFDQINQLEKGDKS